MFTYQKAPVEGRRSVGSMGGHFNFIHCSGKHAPGHLRGHGDQFARQKRSKGGFHGGQVILNSRKVSDSIYDGDGERVSIDCEDPEQFDIPSILYAPDKRTAFFSYGGENRVR